ncbi:alkaline phosphatase family protein [Maioricimonas sp. JC845]|uniref:alkaline phosphatase family protein n=1 Tax=Maioricimonas sp. JC845 TaxID=3232138 RepID=UPI003457E9F4
MNTSTNRKLVVIGLDGATYDIIEPLAAQGDLPNFARLLEGGTRGRLKSVYPPLTPPSWSTFSTGRNPAAHGIFDFTLSAYDVTGPKRFTNFNALKAATFWELLNERGLECGVVNLPITYPPKPMQGFLISGMDTPSDKVTFTFPEQLADELAEHGIDHRANFFFRDEQRATDAESIFQKMLRVERTHKDSMVYLLKNKPWDAFVGVFMLADKVGHFFWHLRGQTGPSGTKDAVQRAYQELDGYIGEILEAIPEDARVVLVSDHGFGDKKRVFFVNEWLRREGFLSLKPKSLGATLKSLRARTVTRSGSQILEKARLGFLKPVLPSSLLTHRYNIRLPASRQSVDLVDWPQTRAYGASYGIYVNLEGRTGYGAVKAGDEYNAVREQIRDRLQQAIDPVRGDKPFSRILFKEEVYSGPHLDDAPDLVFDFDSLDDDLLPSCAFRFARVWGRRQHFGTHHYEGMFLAKGPGIRKGHRLDECRIVDVAPTMFHLLGQPIPRDFDGHVLEDIFEPGESAAAPEYCDSAERTLDRDEASATYSDEEADAVARRLRELGYID